MRINLEIENVIKGTVNFDEDLANIGRYATENGSTAAARHSAVYGALNACVISAELCKQMEPSNYSSN